MADNPVLGYHLTESAVPEDNDAVKVEELPKHTLFELALILAVAVLPTVTTEVVVALQPLLNVPTIVYVVVEIGFAITELPVLALKPVLGDQV